jgi:hypothetical protein
MFWIVDRAPRDEDTDPLLWIATGRHPGRDDMARLMKALEAQGVPHAAVRKPPFADYLVDMEDKDRRIEIRPDGRVFAYGSTTLHEVSTAMGWTPGFVDGPAMDECDAPWGAHMLNFGARIETLGTMPVPDDQVFIRPVDDGKSFAGKCVDPAEFESWRRGVLDVKGWTNLPPTTRVVVGVPRRIEAEWRIAVVDGVPVTASIYRDGSRLRNELGAPADVMAFAVERVAEWRPRAAFIMDVCATPDGLRIVETNSISSAGFYSMDMEVYVAAIEASSLSGA